MADQIQIVKQPSANDVNAKNEELFRFQTFFPLDIFPDTIILDRFKINVVKHDLFSERVTTVPLTGEVNVKVNHGILVAQIEISTINSIEATTVINNAPNAEAARFRELVEGIVVGIQQGVNFLGMTKEEVIKSSTTWGAIQVES